METVAQVKFEPGYYIGNDSVLVKCLILNRDWANNPDKFQYRLEADSLVHMAELKDVMEFGVTGDSKYVRAELPVDQSIDDVKELGTSKDPIWKTEKIFLKVLVEGSASLFHLKTKGRGRFFFSVNGGQIQQLVYKQYAPQPLQLAVNDTYRQQLFMQVNCLDEEYNRMARIAYRASDLVTYFREYNSCKGDKKPALTTPSRERFCLSLLTGLNIAGLTIAHTNTYVMPSLEFTKKYNLTLGLEGEFVLPFNKNKWSLPVNLLYHKYTASAMNANSDSVSANFRAIQAAFGLRYHVFLNRSSRLFFCGLFNYNWSDEGFSKLYTPHRTLVIWSHLNVAFGTGITFGFFSAELRYYTPVNLLRAYAQWSSEYRVFSLIARFRLLKAH